VTGHDLASLTVFKPAIRFLPQQLSESFLLGLASYGSSDEKENQLWFLLYPAGA
jgi:hypothetical protein